MYVFFLFSQEKGRLLREVLLLLADTMQYYTNGDASPGGSIARCVLYIRTELNRTSPH